MFNREGRADCPIEHHNKQTAVWTQNHSLVATGCKVGPLQNIVSVAQLNCIPNGADFLLADSCFQVWAMTHHPWRQVRHI